VLKVPLNTNQLVLIVVLS